MALARMNAEARRAMFAQWKNDTGRTYTTLDQENRRFRTWTLALNDMVRHNLLPSASWFRGLNRFSDMPWEQFSEERLMTDTSVATALEKIKDAPLHEVGGEAPPPAWDWRAEGVMPAVRDQGPCGAGWAHAGIAALEAAAVLDEAAPAGDVDLSEQQMLDCVNPSAGYLSWGCKAGHADEVFRYAAASFIVPEALIPYTGQDGGACAAPRVSPPGAVRAYSRHGFVRVGDSAAALMDAVSSQGPVVAYLNVLPELVAFTGGVYQPGQCAATYNHAMLIVGYNATAGVGAPGSYWLLRNSWGADWGEEGHVRVQMLADDAPGGCRLFSGLMYAASTVDQLEPPPSPAAGAPQPPPSPLAVPQPAVEPSPVPEQPPRPLQLDRPEPTPQLPAEPAAEPEPAVPLPAADSPPSPPLMPVAETEQLLPPLPEPEQPPPAGLQPAAEAQPSPTPPLPPPQPPVTGGLPAQQPPPPHTPLNPALGDAPGLQGQPLPSPEPTPVPEPAPAPLPSQQPPVLQQPPLTQPASAPSLEPLHEPLAAQHTQHMPPPSPSPAPPPGQATSPPTPLPAQAEPALSQPSDMLPPPGLTPPLLPPVPPASNPSRLPPSRRQPPRNPSKPLSPMPPLPSPAHEQPVPLLPPLEPPPLQPPPPPPTPSPTPPPPLAPSPKPAPASNVPPPSLPTNPVQASLPTPLGARTCASGVCSLPLQSPYLGASSLAFAAYSSAFPVALVAQAAGAPLRYQKLHPPLTGWIKYTGPAGADALLLAAGQEPDGWSTQVTGRSALDGAQSRHRMLRRVRLVRGPAVVTVLAQETRPGEWQLRVYIGYTMQPLGPGDAVKLAGGVTVEMVPPSPDGQQPASFIIRTASLRLEGALRSKAAPVEYGAWLDIAAATGGADMQLLPKPLAGLLANV